MIQKQLILLFMKTKLIYTLAAMLCFASCQKTIIMDLTIDFSERSDNFTATTETELSTRTAISDDINSSGEHALYWMAGDQISIYDGTNTAIYSTDSNLSTTAEFARSKGLISNSATEYVAFYPSTITVADMTLPALQNYVENNVENFPMRAISTNKTLSFNNLCGIFRFSLKSEEDNMINISSIVLSADKGMSGTFTVGNDNAAVVLGTDGVVLNCTEPVELNSTTSKQFNIVVPQGEYNPLKVKICSSDGKEINLVSEGTIKVNRSEITNISLTLSKSTFDTSLESIPITDVDVDFTER